MSPKSLRQGAEKPLERMQSPPALTGLVNLPVTAGDQTLLIAVGFGLGRKGRHAGQVRGSSLVKQVKTAQLVQPHTEIRLRFQLIELLLQLGPERLLGGEELL